MQKVTVRKKIVKNIIPVGYLNSDWFKCGSCGYTVRMLSLRDFATCSQCGGRMSRIWKHRLHFTSSAIRSIIDELRKYPNVETGGVFLGYRHRGHYFVSENICGGTSAIRRSGTFIPDWSYINRVVNKQLTLSHHLCFLGIWHKHNHTLEPAFSKADLDMHNVILNSNGYCISCLFQKQQNGSYVMQYICNRRKPNI